MYLDTARRRRTYREGWRGEGGLSSYEDNEWRATGNRRTYLEAGDHRRLVIASTLELVVVPIVLESASTRGAFINSPNTTYVMMLDSIAVEVARRRRPRRWRASSGAVGGVVLMLSVSVCQCDRRVMEGQLARSEVQGTLEKSHRLSLN